jgi:hypothetical protein
MVTTEAISLNCTGGYHRLACDSDNMTANRTLKLGEVSLHDCGGHRLSVSGTELARAYIIFYFIGCLTHRFVLSHAVYHGIIQGRC